MKKFKEDKLNLSSENSLSIFKIQIISLFSDENPIKNFYLGK